MIFRLLFLSLTLLLLTPGCGLPPKMTLADINPVRTYKADKDALYDVVRQFATQESYKVERFELESGSIKAHKVLAIRAPGPGQVGATDTRHVVLGLKMKTLSEGIVEVTANIAYADYSGSFSSEDEGLLVSEYNHLFSFLDEHVKK